MQESVYISELEVSLKNIRELTDRVGHDLQEMSNIIDDTVATGAGIWDSDTAILFKERWDVLREQFPEIIQTFNVQENNLALFISNLNKIEEP